MIYSNKNLLMANRKCSSILFNSVAMSQGAIDHLNCN